MNHLSFRGCESLVPKKSTELNDMWLKKLGSSFVYAGQGFCRVARAEGNLRIHLTATFYVSVAGFLCRVSATQWALLCICFAMVIGAELINTSIETLSDVVTTKPNAKIGAAKDIAAGAVLVCAVGTAGAAAAIFGKVVYWRNFMDALSGNLPLAVLLILTIPAAIFFIKGRKTWK